MTYVNRVDRRSAFVCTNFHLFGLLGAPPLAVAARRRRRKFPIQTTVSGRILNIRLIETNGRSSIHKDLARSTERTYLADCRRSSPDRSNDRLGQRLPYELWLHYVGLPANSGRFSILRDRLRSAMCGRRPVGKGFVDADAMLVGAAMSSTCRCGAHGRWP